MRWYLLLIFMSQSLMALDFNEMWSKENRLYLQMNCTEDETYCLEWCQQKNQCKIFAGECKDCIGTNMLMTQIFDQMGTQYRNSGELFNFNHFKKYITENSFISFTSKSIYNQIEPYDSPTLKLRFQSLCPNNVDYPIVLFTLNQKTSGIKKIAMVICGEDIYGMNDSPEIRKIDTGLVPFF